MTGELAVAILPSLLFCSENIDLVKDWFVRHRIPYYESTDKSMEYYGVQMMDLKLLSGGCWENIWTRIAILYITM